MSAMASIEFCGTDEEIEKYLLEFARIVGGWTVRAPRGWILSAGATLSTNPNTIPVRLRVVRDGDSLSLHDTPGRLPWTRAKADRIASFRQGQLADYLTARIRGSGPEKFSASRLAAPFAPFGAGVQSLTASFAWCVASGLAALAFAFLAATVASYPLMSLSILEITERAAVTSLPPPAETAAIGFGFRLGTALVFAFPLAFFVGVVHAGALVAADLWRRAARLPQASFLFLAILITAAFFPFLPLLAVPIALFVPAATHLGYTFVWGRRRERVGEGRRPRTVTMIVAILLSASLAGILVPPLAEGKALTDRLVLFRDNFMLGNSPGRAVAEMYYRHTLYTADPLKKFYSADKSDAVRSQRIAICPDPDVAALLRARRFTIVPEGTEPHDVWAQGRVLKRGPVEIPYSDPGELSTALDKLSRATFRGSTLREVYGVAWRSLYYVGPIVTLLVLVGFFCPAVSILFRNFSPKTAVAALIICSLCATGLPLFLIDGDLGTPAEIRNNPTVDRIASGLVHDSLAVRHEAAVQSFYHPHPKLADWLLTAIGDEDLRVRLWACAALGKTGDSRALGPLIARLNDPEIFVRYRAAEGLGFLGDPRAELPLLRMMKERSWYEGLYASEALHLIRSGKP
jgi:hypothetical protein